MLKDGYGVFFNKVILRMGRTDLRWGIDKLAALLEMEYGFDLMEEGTLYLFCGRRLDRIKGLLYDSDGYILLTKRLTNGSFQWPRNSDEAREMSAEDFSRLMEGYTVESSIKSYPRIDPDENTDGGEVFSHKESEYFSSLMEIMKGIGDIDWAGESVESMKKIQKEAEDILQCELPR